jgi:hypothetical protein
MPSLSPLDYSFLQQPALVPGDHKFPSLEGTQQGDPAAMCYFSIDMQPLLLSFSSTSDLKPSLVGTIVRWEVLFRKSAKFFIFKVLAAVSSYSCQRKTLRYDRTMKPTIFADLFRAYLKDVRYDDAAVPILGVPPSRKDTFA